MAHIRHDPTTTQKGDITYDPSIVIGIVAISIGNVEGVKLLDGKNKGIKLTFEKQGSIIADVRVKVDGTENVSTLAYKIQQSIKHTVESMTSYKVSKVDVHVQDVNFPENSAI